MIHVGHQEVLLIAAVVLLLFAPKRLPELVRSLGQSIKEFRKGSQGEGDHEEKDKN